MEKKDAESELRENRISWMEFDKFEQKKLIAPDLWSGAHLLKIKVKTIRSIIINNSKIFGL